MVSQHLDRPAWTVGFEAVVDEGRPSPPTFQTFREAAARCLQRLPSAWGSEASMGYPEWLDRWAR